jgi:integrase
VTEVQAEPMLATSTNSLVLDATVRTREGIEFDASADRWAYRDGVDDVSLDFTELQGLSSELVEGAKATLRWYATHRSPGHLMNLFNRLLHFSRSVSATGRVLSSFVAVDILSYRAQLDTSAAWYVGTLAGLLKKWHGLGYPGVDADVLLLFQQLRLKGNAKGFAVLTMDPEEGPYTQIEVEGLQAALNAAYAEGRVEAADYLMAWLYMLLGQRNKQYAALKTCDVQVKSDADGNLSYSVMMPSAKKGTASARDRLVERPIVEQFGEVLVEYAQRVQKSFRGVLPDTLQAPLFPDYKGPKGSTGYEFHRTADDIGKRLVRVLERLSVQSERTGMALNVNARRFRRTLGTRAAEEGHGPLVIAGLLDHADIQNVGVYTANSPAIIERIDRAIAMEMAPLAQAFAGTIVDSSYAEADAANRIIDLRVDRSGKAMGECGKQSYCGFSAPIACYTCNSFEAWLDGPHEAVLTHLLDRREQLRKTSDQRIASVNDRTILAVAAVIQRCLEIQNEPAEESQRGIRG